APDWQTPHCSTIFASLRGTPMTSSLRHAALMTLLLALAGCEGGRSSLPDANVRIIHAAPSYGTVAFLREERPEATLNYRESAGFLFDVDRYDMHVEVTNLAGDRVRPISMDIELDVNHDYSFVIEETSGLGVTTLTFPKLAPSSS